MTRSGGLKIIVRGMLTAGGRKGIVKSIFNFLVTLVSGAFVAYGARSMTVYRRSFNKL